MSYYYKFNQIHYGDIRLVVKSLKDNVDFPINFYKLRQMKINELTKTYNIPFCVIADLIKEFISNVKGNLTKLIKYQINEFVMKQRDHNRIYHSLTIESIYVSEKGFYPSILEQIKTNDKTFRWINVKHDFKLIYDRYTKEYYVNIPKYVYTTESTDRKPICSLDPGERTFQTLYGMEHVITFGNTMRQSIEKKLFKIDEMKSKLDKCNNRKKRKYSKA